MKPFLLDVNALIALMWPSHEFHEPAQQWFKRAARRGWATSPFTQIAFVRIVSNPAFSPHAVTPTEAIDLLSANLDHGQHRFWKDDVGVVQATNAFRSRLQGHRQITDSYLIGLAARNNATLATFDDGLLSLLSAEQGELVELIAR
jgi:toxin-antitoxin system PIN domain toxin